MTVGSTPITAIIKLYKPKRISLLGKWEDFHEPALQAIIIITNFIYIASISITVLGALQYHKKCIKTTLTKKK